MNKAVFLDRDGVINKDKTDYVYRIEDLIILDGVTEALNLLKKEGFKLIVITNQSGINKGIYSSNEVNIIHHTIQELTGFNIDAFYYCPYARDFTNSLSRKPGTLMFEKAISRFDIIPYQSFMVGDRIRDLEPAKKLNIEGFLVENEYHENYNGLIFRNLYHVAKYIIHYY